MSSRSGTTDDIEVGIPDVWLRSVEDRFRESTGGGGFREQKPRIFRVPLRLRENDHKAYEPIMVSLGPYHRGKESLRAMEERKWHYLNRLPPVNSEPGNLKYYLGMMKALETRARSCYSEKIEMSSDEFAEMLLLDGNFIVQFLKMIWSNARDIQDPTTGAARSNESDSRDPTTRTSWFPIYAYYDMILLENQLPFFILEKLYDKSPVVSEDNGTNIPFSELVLSYFSRYCGITIRETAHPSEIHHLLHLFHCWIISEAAPGDTQNPEQNSGRGTPQTVWHKLLECLCPCCGSTSDASDLMRESIPNAVQLNEAGIKFKKRDETYSLPYVTFKNGVVEMSHLTLYEGTGIQLKNLIAFEQCHTESGAVIGCYAIFMERLVLKKEDVALLQKRGVLLNRMGSEEAAVRLFSHLCKNAIVPVESSHLKDLFIQVNQYHKSSYRRWRAMLGRDYFGNPWSITSFCAAFALLALSVIGTAFTIANYKLNKRKQV